MMLRTAEFLAERSWTLRAIGIPHRAVQDAQNHRNSSPSNPGRSEPSEFHTERSRILKTAGIPHRASERSKTAQNHRNSARAVQDHQYLRNSTASGRSDCLRTFVIPHQGIQDAQNRRNSAPSGPAFLEPLSRAIRAPLSLPTGPSRVRRVPSRRIQGESKGISFEPILDRDISKDSIQDSKLM